MKPKSNKNQTLVDFIVNRGIRRNFVAAKIGVSYGRMIAILRGADTYTHEAVKLSKTLETPIDHLFPHLFQKQDNAPKSKSHE